MVNKGTKQQSVFGDVVGVVLAGGLSRRMGGNDKAMLQVAGQPLVLRAIDRLSPQVDAVVVSTNQSLAEVALRNVPLIADCMPDNPGPLVGILSAMQWMEAHAPKSAWLCSISVDTPFVPGDLVQQFAARHSAADKACVAVSRGRVHPTIGLFHVSLKGSLQSFLQSGERKAGKWVQEVGARRVDFDAADHDPFFNVNTPDDLRHPDMQKLAD